MDSDREVKISCVHCKATGSVPAEVTILDMIYEIYQICKWCSGKGYHIMIEDKGDNDAA